MPVTVTVPQAFPYQGSKRLLAGRILALFPGDGVGRLVEPLAGSAAVSVAARQRGVASSVALSDVNGPLMDLWRMIVHEPGRLIENYTSLWHEQLADPASHYLLVRARFNATHDPSCLLYLLCRCVKAAVRYNRKTGEFNQSADHRRLGARPDRLAERINAVSILMRQSTIEVCGFEEALLGADVGDVVYLDPPYQGTSEVADHRYLHGLRHGAFATVLRRAVDGDVSFIVSYDEVRQEEQHRLALPTELGLTHRHVEVGVSAQATLLGRNRATVESLYLSPALVRRLGGTDAVDERLRMGP